MDEHIDECCDPPSGGHRWALVLAAGDGSRLAGVTRGAGGVVVPKQFCSLDGGPTLLGETLLRAEAMAPAERCCVVVAAAHQRWWEPELTGVNPWNIIVQPQNRGTAIGILLPLLHILERDPLARIVLLPADHYIGDELLFWQALGAADELGQLHPDELVLLGITPEWPDPDLGYIVPASGLQGELPKVQRFVEKPCEAEGERLLALGALWNAFVVCGAGATLLQVFERHMPEVADALRGARVADCLGGDGTVHLAATYEQLPTVDFSHDLLERESERLRVYRAPACGWADLGTPARLAETLRRRRQQVISLGGTPAEPAAATHPRQAPVLSRQLAARLAATA